MVCIGPDHRQHPGTQRGHSRAPTPRTTCFPPHSSHRPHTLAHGAPPAHHVSHPAPTLGDNENLPSALLSLLCLEPLALCRHRASVHLRSRTSPVLPGITPSEISVCVCPQDTTLRESDKCSHFLSFPRILQICCYSSKNCIFTVTASKIEIESKIGNKRIHTYGLSLLMQYKLQVVI